jgi:hypothetical protein
MTPVSLTSRDLSDTKPAPLDRVKQLATTLLSERGETSGALVARQLRDVLAALDASDRHGFQRYLATGFQPTERRCARRQSAISPTARRKPRPVSRRPPIRPARNCCDE